MSSMCCTRGRKWYLLPGVGSASGNAACERAVSGVFKDIPDKYWGIPLRVGDPEGIILSVINAARPGLGESHDISVGINALQILRTFRYSRFRPSEPWFGQSAQILSHQSQACFVHHFTASDASALNLSES